MELKKKINLAIRWIEKNPSGIFISFFILLLPIYFLVWEVIEPMDFSSKCFAIVNLRIFWHIIVTIVSGLIITIILEYLFRKAVYKMFSVKYKCHNQDIGWTGWKEDGQLAGSPNPGLRMEAIRIELGHRLPPGMGIEYQVHIQDRDWLPPVSNGAMAGTEGRALRLEAIRMRLINRLENYSLLYQVRIAGTNEWSIWHSDNEIAGTVGEARAIEAIRILVLKS